MKPLLTILAAILFFAGYGQQTNTGFRNADLPKAQRQERAKAFRNENQQAQPARRAERMEVDMNTPQAIPVKPGARAHPAVRPNDVVDMNKPQVPLHRANAKHGPRQEVEVDYTKPQEIKKRN
jgi:hypothetical protein